MCCYLGQAGAKFVHEAQVEERLGVAELAGGLVQLRSALPIPLRPPAVPVAVPQLQHCIHIPLRRANMSFIQMESPLFPHTHCSV